MLEPARISAPAPSRSALPLSADRPGNGQAAAGGGADAQVAPEHDRHGDGVVAAAVGQRETRARAGQRQGAGAVAGGAADGVAAAAGGAEGQAADRPASVQRDRRRIAADRGAEGDRVLRVAPRNVVPVPVVGAVPTSAAGLDPRKGGRAS